MARVRLEAGDGETNGLEPTVQLFTISVIVFGMTAAKYTTGGLIQILAVLSDHPLVGTALRDTDAHRRFHLLIVGIKSVDGQILFNPDAGDVFRESDTLIVLVASQHIESFQRHHNWCRR